MSSARHASWVPARPPSAAWLLLVQPTNRPLRTLAWPLDARAAPEALVGQQTKVRAQRAHSRQVVAHQRQAPSRWTPLRAPRAQPSWPARGLHEQATAQMLARSAFTERTQFVQRARRCARASAQARAPGAAPA